MAVETADELHRTLQELEGLEGQTPLVEAVQQAVDSAASLFGVTGCGVMFLDDGQVLHYAAASDGHGRELEQAQMRRRHGPVCPVVGHQRGRSGPPTSRPTNAGPRSTASSVKRVCGRSWASRSTSGEAIAGSLDAYCDTEHEWDDAEVEGLQAYAQLIERLLLTAMRAQRHERTVKQLEHALEHRIVIERAVGVLMERHRLDQLTAFERLRSSARDSRRRAADIAAEIVASAGTRS